MSQSDEPQKYIYTFTAGPTEGWGWNEAVGELFASWAMVRQWRETTEKEFETWRSNLGHQGISLQEIERVPWQEPEKIE